MSYELIEVSTELSSPVELYAFSYSENAFYYTSSDREVVYIGNTYIPVAIGRTKVPTSSDASQAGFTISISEKAAIFDLFRIAPPSEPVILTMFQSHYGDVDAEYIVVAKGRIINAEYKGDGNIDLTCESVFSSMQRAGLRRRCQNNCSFALYDNDCGVGSGDFEEVGQVLSISGTSVEVNVASGKILDWYAGGKITWTNSVAGNLERRMIRLSAIDGVLTLSSTPVGLITGADVKLYPGCDHTLMGVNGCGPKFNNTARYGGTPFMPQKKPFSGSSVF
jgi:uncharacterized phage protein (TIGR02218 family)